MGKIDLENSKPKFGKIEILLISCIIIKLIICLWPLYCGSGYSGKELYMIALSNHPAIGYVDIPPLTPLLLAVVRTIFGTSLFVMQLLPSVSGALIIYFTYLIVKKLGGNFYAQLLALICVTLAPFSLLLESTYTCSYLNNLVWIIILYLVVSLLKTENRKYWIYIGIFFGIGLLTKWSVIYLGLGLVTAFLITTHKNITTYNVYLRYRQFWIGVIIALLIFSPFLIWNFYYGFPTSEYMLNALSYREANGIGIITSIQQIILFMNPLTLPVWLLGFYYFTFDNKGKKYRILATVFIIILVLCLFKHIVFYTPTAFFPVLFAGGAVFIEKLLSKHRLNWLKTAYILLIILAAVWIFPLVRPILSMNNLQKYYTPIITTKLTKLEKNVSVNIPQWYAERFDWERLTEKVAQVYNSLPAKEKSDTCIFTNKYNVAAAISFFGKKYKLPNAICRQNQYYLWGPKNYTGKIMIDVSNDSRQDIKKVFNSVKLMCKISFNYGTPYVDHLSIWLIKKPKFGSFKSLWPNLKEINYNVYPTR
ncbi:MAG: hypothetical protein GY756_09460 [bacterium]|nr:hypothetical protein [bacterium]